MLAADGVLVLKHHHLREIVQRAPKILRREHVCQRNQLEITSPRNVDHNLLIIRMDWLVQRIKNSATVHIFDVAICIIPIVGSQFPADHLFIKLHVCERLNLPNAFKLM